MQNKVTSLLFIILIWFYSCIRRHFNIDDLNSCVSSFAKVLLHEFKGIFPEETPNSLPPIQGIEHQIDFMTEASIWNRLAYRNNPDETKKLYRQVEE